jgi:hypothetical protein
MKINFTVDFNVSIFYTLYISCGWDAMEKRSGFIFEHCKLSEDEKVILESVREYFKVNGGEDEGKYFLWAYNNFEPKGEFKEFEKGIDVTKTLKLNDGTALISFIKDKYKKVDEAQKQIEQNFEDLDVQKRLDIILELSKNESLKEEFPFFLVPQFRTFLSAGANKETVFLELSNKFTDESMKGDASVGFHEMLHVMLDIKNRPEIKQEFDSPFLNSSWQMNNVQFEELIVYGFCSIFDNVSEEQIQKELDMFSEQGNLEMVFIYKYLPEAIEILKGFLSEQTETDETRHALVDLYRKGLREHVY